MHVHKDNRDLRTYVEMRAGLGDKDVTITIDNVDTGVCRYRCK